MSPTPDYQMDNDSDSDDEPEMLNYQDTLKLFPVPVQVKTEPLEATDKDLVQVKLENNDDRFNEEYILGAAPTNEILSIVRSATGLDTEELIISDSDETDIGSESVASNKDVSSIVISNVKSVGVQDSLEDLLDDVNIDDFEIAGALVKPSTSKVQQAEASPPKQLFQCNSCSFSAKTRFALARHEATHKEDLEKQKTNNNNNISITKTSPVKAEIENKPNNNIKTSSEKTEIKNKPKDNIKTSPEKIEIKNKPKDNIRTSPEQIEIKSKPKDNIKTSSEKTKFKNKLATVFKCSNCTFSSKFRIAIHKHQCDLPAKAEKPEEDTHCKFCSFVGKSRTGYLNHQRVHRKPTKIVKPKPTLSLNLFRCVHCVFVAKSKAGLVSHLRYNHSETMTKMTLRCRICHFKTTLRSVYTKHMQEHKENAAQKKPVIPQGDFKCNNCSYVANSKVALGRHCISHINKMPLIQCKLCSFYSTEHCLNTHYLKVHHKVVSKRDEVDETAPKTEEPTRKSPEKNESSKKEPDTLKCEYCSFTTLHYRSIKGHLELHQRRVPILTCKYCKFRSTKIALTRHINNVHLNNKDEKPIATIKKEDNKRPEYKCKYCSYTSKCESSLDTHLLAHTKHNQPVYSCTECDFKSTVMELSKHMMAIHKNIVTEEPQATATTHVVSCNVNNFVFVCEICNYITNEKTALLVHKRAHQPQIVEETPPADKEATKTSQGSERKSIDKNGNFQCSECKRVFTNRGAFAKHTCRDTWYKCDKCPYSTYLSSKLTFHKNTKHGETKEGKKKPEKVLHINIDEVRLYKNKNYNVNIAANENSKGSITAVNGAQPFKCSLCNYFFTTLKGLKIHTKIVHSNPQKRIQGNPNKLIFQCEECMYVSQWVFNYVRHMKISHDVVISAGEARKQAAAKRKMGKERSGAKSAKQEFSCNKCDYKTPIRFKLKRHKLKHLDENRLRDRVEVKETKSQAEESPQATLRCIAFACYYVCKNKHAMDKHYNSCHIQH